MNIALWNINILGLGFMLVFSAFQASSFLESVVFKDYNRHGITALTGFHSLAIVYGTLGLSNWFAPAIVLKLGSKWSMTLSVLANIGFIFCMYEPYEWVVFVMSALLGMGGGLLWCANGEVIARNSPGDTKARNTGIFWSWFNLSSIVGNTFLYFQLGESDTISDDTRHTIYLVLGGFSIAGMFSFLLLKQPPTESEMCDYSSAQASPEEDSLLQPIKDGMQMAVSCRMALLHTAFAFTGLSLNFWSSVFIVMVSNVFPKRNYLALAGLCIGVGQVASGFVWSALTYVIGRRGVLLGTTLVTCTAYLLTFLSFPHDSATTSAAKAQEVPLIASNIYLALFTALLLGLGDGGFNVSIYAALGTLYEHNPAPAFAVFKFVQGSLATAAFLYCGILYLPYQLLILAVFCVLGAASFLVLDCYSGEGAGDEGGYEEYGEERPYVEESRPLIPEVRVTY